MSNKIGVISFYTTKEILKSRILYNVILLGIGLLLLTYVAYSFTYGEPSRIALDFGLGFLTLSSVGIAILMGVSLIRDEIDNRTIYMIISRPVSRIDFILGRLLGLSFVLLINILLLGLITLLLYFLIGGTYSSLIGWSILYTYFEAIWILLIVATLSVVTNKTLSIIIALLVYAVGHGIDGTKFLFSVKNSGLLTFLVKAYDYVLPGFYRLNIKNFVLYESSLPTDYLISTTAYFLMYTFFLVSLLTYIFNKKNLD